MSPSGVGTQTKYVIEALLKTGRYQVVSFGGAIKHPDHKPQKTDEYGDDWIIWPVDGYGNPDMVRAMIHQQKPDILWFMTDPRFYGWLWDIEHEIRPHIPIVYYHVWDNYPYPKFNKPFYDSTDHIACISKLTHDIVKTVSPDTPSYYIPHAVDDEIFFPEAPEKVEALRQELFKEQKDKFICFWNNRNARRKQSGTLIWWFKDFLDRVGHDNAVLIMHTDVKDVHGQDLEAIIHQLGLVNGEVLFSREKVDASHLARVYNAIDCTINIADAEGFGLATLESMACGSPTVVTMTGGLQDQVLDDDGEWYGIGIHPSSQAIIGSQDVPYIYEDRINKEEFLSSLQQMYDLGPKGRYELGLKASKRVQRDFNFDTFVDTWEELMTRIHDTEGSWETRTGYTSYEVRTF